MTDDAPLFHGIVQPWDCDVMGHFTVRRYAAAFDDASYQLLFRLSGGEPMVGAKLGWADVRQTYDYHAEMLPGTVFAITGKPMRLGTKSLDLAYAMHRSDTGAPVASMVATLVRLDLVARQSVAIEPATRTRVEAMLAGSG